jgi:MOSC domain-containing protein YiiM
MAVERLKSCDNVLALAEELGVHRRLLYHWRDRPEPIWREELPGADLPWGVFGENLTTEGIVEETVHIGD